MIYIGNKNTEEKVEISSLCKVRRIKINYLNTVLEDNGEYYKLVVDMTPTSKMLSRIMTDESELHRIIQHLHPEGVELEGKYRFFNDIIVLKVGNSNKYMHLINAGNTKRNIDDIGTIEIRTFADAEKNNLVRIETFKHFIVNASHIRGQKGIFVNTANGLYDKADEIIRCGIPKDTKVEYISKWTSYYGLQASNSTPVTMPKCVIIDDLELKIEDRVDIVNGTIIKECVTKYKTKPDDYADVKYFEVDNNKNKEIPTCPWDGMGICDISIAKQWAEDLGLDYIPGSFQVRLCGVKGCLFVMDIQKYINEKNLGSGEIKDIDGEIFDFNKQEFNVILTNSMFKYGKFYNEKKKSQQWKKEFSTVLYDYHRTFNICSYAVKYEDMNDTMLCAYQPLQSLYELANNDESIHELCEPTVGILKEMRSDIDKFLFYMGIQEPDDVSKVSVPPYYQALYYNHSLANDRYISEKIENSLTAATERSYTGKLYLNGNYTVVGSDPFALLQWAFLRDESKVVGLLQRDEIYSNYWNRKRVDKVNVWRNPHIFCEHWIGSCINNEDVNEWFKYLPSNTIVSVWDTNLLRMNSADTDGDIIATVNNRVLREEVQRIIKNGKANTIYPDLDFNLHKKEEDYVEIGNIKEQIISENNGFKNDIGGCTNKITALWGTKQDKTVQDFIKIMSVVDSLVIDFPKTSQKTDIPKEIREYIKGNNIKKQEFEMYLPSNRELRRKEEKQDKGKESLFSHDPCTLNKICWYLREQLDTETGDYEVPDFDFHSLLYTNDKNIFKRAVYKNVCQKIIKFYKYQDIINIEKRKDKGNYSQKKERYAALYSAFYDSCRNDLLALTDYDNFVSKDIIIDCCILCCYTEESFVNKVSVFNLLWNMFPEELIQRAKGDFRPRKCSQEQRDSFSESVNKKLQYSICRFKKEYEKRRLDRMKEIPCLQPMKNGKEIIRNGNFTIYRDNISGVKKIIPTSEDKYILKRKAFYVLYVMQKRIESLHNLCNVSIPFQEKSEKKVNYSIIAEILGIGVTEAKQLLEWLETRELIAINTIKKELRVLKDIDTDIDTTVIYYEGNNYLSAFRLMNRYLSK